MTSHQSDAEPGDVEFNAGTPLIIVEQPNAWLDHDEVGASYGRLVGILAQSCAKLGLRTILEPGSWGEDFRARAPSAYEIWITFHTINREENVWSIKESYVKNWFSFDRAGYSGWSSLATKGVAYEYEDYSSLHHEEMVAPIVENMLTNNVSKYRQPPRQGNRCLPDRYIFFPLQVEDDLALDHGALPQELVLGSAVDFAAQHQRNLVIKQHPFSKWNYSKYREHEGCNRFVHWYSGSVIDALEGSDCVLVCNSGVGFEGLLLDKPVYSYGASEYASATRCLKTLADLEEVFLRHNHEVDLRRTRAFLVAYLKNHCIHDSNVQSATDFLTMAVSVWTEAGRKRSMPNSAATQIQVSDEARVGSDIVHTMRRIDRHLSIQGLAPRQLVAEIRRSNLARERDLETILTLLKHSASSD